MSSRYVIGDVHGCLKTLKALIAKLEPGIPITFVGDLIDRGPSDSDVVDFVRAGGYDCVMGNHEHMMLDRWFGAHEYYHSDWDKNGGKGLGAFTEAQKQWMSKRPMIHAYTDVKDSDGRHLLVCHAGYALRRLTDKPIPLDAVKEIIKNRIFAFLWSRNVPLEIEGYYQVFGHTALKEANVQPTWAAIDTGCVYHYTGEHAGTKLTAFRFPEMTLTQQICLDEKQ